MQPPIITPGLIGRKSGKNVFVTYNRQTYREANSFGPALSHLTIFGVGLREELIENTEPGAPKRDTYVGKLSLAALSSSKEKASPRPAVSLELSEGLREELIENTEPGTQKEMLTLIGSLSRP